MYTLVLNGTFFNLKKWAIFLYKIPGILIEKNTLMDEINEKTLRKLEKLHTNTLVVNE